MKGFAWLHVAVLCVCAFFFIFGETQSSSIPLDRRSAKRLDDGWYWCFEDKCRCQGHVANCSSNSGELLFVPRLPAEITVLVFTTYRFYWGIIPDNFFVNVTNITSLDLSNNAIRGFSNNSFSVFNNLTTFIGRYCRNFYTNRNHRIHIFPALYAVPTLRNLQLNCIEQDPDYHRFPLLENLHLDRSYLYRYNLTYFARMKSLKNLSVKDTSVDPITDSPLEVETLELRNTGISEFLSTCSPNGTTYFPRLLELDLSNNDDQYFIPDSVCLPTLRYLNLSGNYPAFQTNSFATWKFPNLQALDFENYLFRSFHVHMVNFPGISINKYAFNNNALKYLSLYTKAAISYYRLEFGNDDVHPDSFRGCSSLTTLNLSGHDFSIITDTKVQRLLSVLPSLQTLKMDRCALRNITSLTFAGLSSLRALSLSNNKLSRIPTAAFSTLTSLEKLDLSDNAIAVIQNGALSGLTSLEELDLSKNAIAVIQNGAFKALISLEELDLSNNDIAVILDGVFTALTSLRTLDLSDNRLVCNCSMLWFRRWVARDDSVFANSKGSYACSNLKDTDVFTYRVSAQSCMFTRDTFVMIFVASLMALLCLLMALCALAWRTRKNVRKFLREMVKMQRLRQALQLQPVHWDYDLFVAYAEEDADWVQEQLKARVENEWGLRLCLHYRDFHPGRRVLDNIEACLETSRKMMVVFSPHFANSRWCQLELGVGLQHAMDRNDELLVVYLSPVPPDDLTAGMAAILRSCTYLRWAERGPAAAVFWNSLRAALPGGPRVARFQSNIHKKRFHHEHFCPDRKLGFTQRS